MITDSHVPRLAAEKALDWVEDGMVVGLGTGRAAMAFLQALAARERAGSTRVRAVASSRSTAERAGHLGITLIGLDEVDAIDVTVDGADEVDPQRNLIKGLGGALLREKVVASCSARWIICVGADKRVERLGARGVLPVEVVPFALPLCLRRFEQLGFPGQARLAGTDRFVTDNGNYIVDCRIPGLSDPVAAEHSILSVPGVVETGFFLNMLPIVLTQVDSRVEVQDT